MPWTAADIPDQHGRTALVTGAGSGLGLESARALAARGATVVLACRTLAKAVTTAERLRGEGESGAGGGALVPLELDLGDLGSVARAVRTVASQVGPLDILLNNAGVMAPPRTLSADGYELQFAVNHLGHFALTRGLLPLLDRPGARVVFVSSGAQYFGRISFDDLQGELRYDRWAAYGQSKLANVMTALELQARLAEAGSPVVALAAHPGIARTNLQPSSVAANGSSLERLAYRLMGPLMQSAAMGALPQLHAATAGTARGGEQYGPDQLGGLRGWPRRVRIAPAALDAAQRRRLWEVSEQLLTVDPVLLR